MWLDKQYTTGVHRVYRYRLYPTRGQTRALFNTLYLLRELYNGALQERITAHRAGIKLSVYDQKKEIVEVRAVRPEFAEIHSHLLQDVVFRLDRAYRAFFRRCKSGEKPGFPRFKGRGRYNTFTFADAGRKNGIRLVTGGKRVRLSGIGDVKLKLHRPIEGAIKQASVTVDAAGHWHIAFVCEGVPTKPLDSTGHDVGVDLGLTAFIATSDGELVDAPKPLRLAERELAQSQRCVSKRKRGSARRRKAVRVLAGKHARVANARRDFHHKLALGLVRAYDSIAIEDLNVKGLAGSMLAKSVHDAGWAQFTQTLADKAECAGRDLVRVNPAGTSQTCSACLAHVPKDLSVRIHRCVCGLVLDRDVNAALNIQRLGRSLRRGAGNGLS